MNVWLYIGIGLLLWVLWDLYSGRVVFIYQVLNRKTDPIKYWAVWSVWFIIAIGVIGTSL